MDKKKAQVKTKNFVVEGLNKTDRERFGKR